MVVDEEGTPVGCVSTAWLAEGFIKDDPGASIVFDLRSSYSVPRSSRSTVVCRIVRGSCM